MIDAGAGARQGVLWHTPDERAAAARKRPAQYHVKDRRMLDDQRAAATEGWESVVRVGQGTPVYIDDKHFLGTELWVNARRPDTLWVSFYSQPTFLWFPAGRDAASLEAVLSPYWPTDLARPRTPRSIEQQQADVARAAAGPIPGPAPGQDRSVRLLVGLALAHNGETLRGLDLSFLKTGVVDPRYLMQGSIEDNPRSNPAVTVVRTLYSRATVRLDWYDSLGGAVCAEIAYAPAGQHETIRALNERFRLHYPLDVPVDVPALLLGLEAVSAPALLEHVTRRRTDAPDLLVGYLNRLAILTQPDVAGPLRPFMSHPAAEVRKTVIRLASRMAPELLGEMQRTETDPDLRARIAAARGSAEPPRPQIGAARAGTPPGSVPTRPTPADPRGVPPPAAERADTVSAALRDALAGAFNRSPTEPSSDAFVLLNPNARANPAAIIAAIAATFPFAPAVTVSQPPEAWGPYFRFGKVTVRTYILPMPMPSDHLEASYEASWLWPTAKADLRSHAAMLTLSADGGDTAVDRMVPLTMLTAAFLGTCAQAAGVFWDAAGHLVRGDVFRDFAARKLPAQLPLLLWIGCPAWPNADGTSRGHTVGLRQFGLPEIETTDAPSSVPDLRDWFDRLAEHLITTGAPIRDGAVIARSATETVAVSYGPSWFGLGERVLQLRHRVPPAPTGPS
jgi:hypothetical protein